MLWAFRRPPCLLRWLDHQERTSKKEADIELKPAAVDAVGSSSSLSSMARPPDETSEEEAARARVALCDQLQGIMDTLEQTEAGRGQATVVDKVIDTLGLLANNQLVERSEIRAKQLEVESLCGFLQEEKASDEELETDVVDGVGLSLRRTPSSSVGSWATATARPPGKVKQKTTTWADITELEKDEGLAWCEDLSAKTLYAAENSWKRGL